MLTVAARSIVTLLKNAGSAALWVLSTGQRVDDLRWSASGDLNNWARYARHPL